MSDSPGRVVFVTGSGSGMGMEAALHLASLGRQVYGSVLNDGERESLAAAARSRGVELRTVNCDVRRQGDVDAAIQSVLSTSGRIDELVQFAGIGLRGFFEDLEIAEIENVFSINLFGLMRVTKAVLPHMRMARSGRIILTSSIGGRMGSMSISGYAASKFAIEGWAECLRQEMAPFGIHVSLLEPGLIRTPHFTVHRNRAKRAVDPSSPYYAWFCQHESIVDNLLAKNRFTTSDVARTVERILNADRPLLRYVVGPKAKWIFRLRRYTPGEWFESVYWAYVRRMVTRPREVAPRLNVLDTEDIT